MSERDQRICFALLWVFALLNYIYADIGMLFSMFLHPEELERVQRGLGSRETTDAFLFGGAILMEISFVAMLTSWFASQRVARWTNILAGLLFTGVIGAIMFGAGGIPPLNYYTLYEAIEIATTGYITWRAWNWSAPNPS